MQNTMQFMAALNTVKVEDMMKCDAFFSPHNMQWKGAQLLWKLGPQFEFNYFVQ